MRPVRCTLHVLDSYARAYGATSEAAVEAQWYAATPAETGAVDPLVGGRQHRGRPESRYRLHRERTGVFAAIPGDDHDSYDLIVTFLRFYAYEQHATAVRLWGPGPAPTADGLAWVRLGPGHTAGPVVGVAEDPAVVDPWADYYPALWNVLGGRKITSASGFACEITLDDVLRDLEAAAIEGRVRQTQHGSGTRANPDIWIAHIGAGDVVVRLRSVTGRRVSARLVPSAPPFRPGPPQPR